MSDKYKIHDNQKVLFGMLMAGEFERTEANTTLFCGKELNNEAYSGVKLSWYDFHARNYDPQLGMWFNVDPLAEKTMSYTPYHYVYNNPVNYVDPDGMSPWSWSGSRGLNSWWSDKSGNSGGRPPWNGFDPPEGRSTASIINEAWNSASQDGSTLFGVNSGELSFISHSKLLVNGNTVTIGGETYLYGVIGGSSRGGLVYGLYKKDYSQNAYVLTWDDGEDSTVDWYISLGFWEMFNYESYAQVSESNFLANDNLFGNISLNDIGTITSAMSIVVTKKVELVKWGLKSLSIPDGTKYLKGWKGFGKGLGYLSTGIYGFNSYSDFANGNNLQGVSNGLMSMYSAIATKGGIAGTIVTTPFFIVDWTMGMDNFLLYQVNYGIEQSNQIQNSNWGVSMWRPGKSLR